MAAAAAELDHGEAQGAGVDARTWPAGAASGLGGSAVPAAGGARGARASRPGRPGCGPCGRSARRRRRRQGRRAASSRPASGSAASPARASASPHRASTTSSSCGRRRARPCSMAMALADLDRVAGRVAEALAHLGEQGRGRQARAVGDADDAAGQGLGALVRRHEGAGAGLDVHDQRLQAAGELLGQDRGGDQRDALDRRGDVADGVEAAVGGREIVGLADDGAASLADDLAQTVRGRAGSCSLGCSPACRACRRCGRGRGRRASGT